MTFSRASFTLACKVFAVICKRTVPFLSKSCLCFAQNFRSWNGGFIFLVNNAVEPVGFEVKICCQLWSAILKWFGMVLARNKHAYGT